MSDSEKHEANNDEEIYVATAEAVEEEAQPVDDSQMTVPSPMKAMDQMDGYTLLVTLLVTSIVVFVASCFNAFGTTFLGEAGLTYWALAGSLLSIVACVILMILKKCAEDASVKAGPFVMIFLLVLWICIVMPCTFQQPFDKLGNGWLGCWLSLAVSGALAGRAFADKAKAVKNAMDSQTGNEATKFALFLGMSSIVVMIAASFTFSGLCGLGSFGTRGYAVALSVISIIAVVIILVFANVANLKQHSGKTNMALSIFLIVWWAIGAFVTTFASPFAEGGISNCGSLNGYIATWISVFCALSLFKACGLDTVRGLIQKAKGGKGGEGNGEAKDEETPEL